MREESREQPVPSVNEAKVHIGELDIDPALAKAATQACRLILEEDASLKSATNQGCKSFGVTKTRLSRIIKKVIPAWFFLERENRCFFNARSSKPIQKEGGKQRAIPASVHMNNTSRV